MSNSEMLKTVVMDVAMGVTIDGGIVDDMVSSYEHAYGGISAKEYDALTSVVTLAMMCMADGMRRGIDLLDALAKAADRGDDLIPVFKDVCVDIAKESAAIGVEFPKTTDIPDFYKASEREQMIFRIDGRNLDDSARSKLANELRVSEDVINSGEIILATKSQCDEIIDTIKNQHDMCVDTDYNPANVKDDSNDMLEAARAAKMAN